MTRGRRHSQPVAYSPWGPQTLSPRPVQPFGVDTRDSVQVDALSSVLAGPVDSSSLIFLPALDYVPSRLGDGHTIGGRKELCPTPDVSKTTQQTTS